MEANAEHPAQTGEIIVRPESKTAWRFWVLVGVFVVVEIASLLYGLRLMPHRNGFMAISSVAMIAGYHMECWLMQVSGK